MMKAMVLIVLIGSASCTKSSVETHVSPQMKPVANAWNGGKGVGPVVLTTDLSGPIASDQNHIVQFSLQMQQPCEQLQLQVRGIDGLTVVSGGGLNDLGKCQPGVVVNRPVVVRLPAQAAGLLVVDVSLQEASGTNGTSVRQSYSRSFPVQAIGGKLKAKSLGRIQTRSGGQPAVELGNPSNAP